MLSHLFRLMWNKKKQNFLLMSEIFVSFLVIFAVFSLLVTIWQNTNKRVGFDSDNVWVIGFSIPDRPDNTDSLVQLHENIRNLLKSLPLVKEVSFVSQNTPYANSQHTTRLTYRNKRYFDINEYQVEDSYKGLLNFRLVSGRWFDKQDQVAVHRPIVINATLQEALFGNNNPIGQIIGEEKDKEKDKRVVIGVVEDLKSMGDYQLAGRAMYTRIDTGAMHWIDDLLIRVSPDADAAFEGRLYKAAARTVKNSSLEIKHLSGERDARNKMMLVPVIITLIVSGFLIINVAFGLLGVLWYNINKRRGEIGLRRAVGATGNAVSLQLLTEALILATFSMIAGSFFAIQFPLLHVFDKPADIYIIAIIFTILFIYGLVTVCSLYPGRQAAAILPAVALHEE